MSGVGVDNCFLGCNKCGIPRDEPQYHPRIPASDAALRNFVTNFQTVAISGELWDGERKFDEGPRGVSARWSAKYFTWRGMDLINRTLTIVNHNISDCIEFTVHYSFSPAHASDLSWRAHVRYVHGLGKAWLVDSDMRIPEFLNYPNYDTTIAIDGPILVTWSEKFFAKLAADVRAANTPPLISDRVGPLFAYLMPVKSTKPRNSAIDTPVFCQVCQLVPCYFLQGATIAVCDKCTAHFHTGKDAKSRVKVWSDDDANAVKCFPPSKPLNIRPLARDLTKMSQGPMIYPQALDHVCRALFGARKTEEIALVAQWMRNASPSNPTSRPAPKKVARQQSN